MGRAIADGKFERRLCTRPLHSVGDGRAMSQRTVVHGRVEWRNGISAIRPFHERRQRPVLFGSACRALGIWPRVVADGALLKAAELRDLRERAQRRGVNKVKMTEIARELFELLQTMISETDSGIIELTEQTSAS